MGKKREKIEEVMKSKFTRSTLLSVNTSWRARSNPRSGIRT